MLEAEGPKMKWIIAIAALVLSSAGVVSAQDITGDWQGTLNAGTTQLHLILHIAKDNDGSLKATIDSVDQRAFGLVVNSISLKNSKLTLTLDKLQASYEGKVNPDATKIFGTWSQGGGYVDLDFKRAKAEAKAQPKPAPPSDIDGAWLGTVDTGAMKLRVVFHIVNTADGLTGTMDSPDTGQSGFPMTAIAEWSVAQNRNEADGRRLRGQNQPGSGDD
jgi:hypothetical protein